MSQIKQHCLHNRADKEASLSSHEEFCLILQHQTGYSSIAAVLSNSNYSM